MYVKKMSVMTKIFHIFFFVIIIKVWNISEKSF